MKKTLTLLLAAVATLSMTAANLFTPSEAQMGTPVKMENVKKAPAGMQAKMMARLASKLKATPNFPASTPDDLVGGYAWTYRQYTGGMTTQPDTLSADQYDQEDNVTLLGINKISDTQIRLTGFMPFPVTATMGTTSGYTTFTVDENQVVYSHSTYGDCTLAAAWYYEGDDTYEAGWYVGDVMGILVDEGIVMDPDVHFYMEIMSGTYANYRLGWVYVPGSTMIPVTDYNAMMSFTYNTRVYDWPVIATENNETYVVSVDNFAGIGTTPVNFTLAEDKTWTADQAVFYTSGDNNFAFANTTDYGVVTGTGTEKVLTFGQNWTGFDANTQYWLGERSATTITLISDEEFVYPTTEPTHIYTVAGSPAGFFGTSWDPTNEANDMTLNAETGKYEWTSTEATIDAGANVEFKVAEDHSWDVSYGLNGGADNVVLTAEKAGKYTLTVYFDPQNNNNVTGELTFIEEAVVEHTYTVAGSPAGFFGNTWDPTIEANNMTLNEETGNYEWTSQEVELTANTNVEFKVTQDHSWDVSYGVDGGSDNVVLTAEQDGKYVLTVYYMPQANNTVRGILTLVEEAPVEYSQFYVVGDFNDWKTTEEEGRIELAANEDGTEFTGNVELAAGDEFKVIAPVANDWKWFGGVDENNMGYFLINDDMLDINISLINGSNFHAEQSGQYTIKVMAAPATTGLKAISEPLVMVVSKIATAIDSINTENTIDNTWYNLQGVKFNGKPAVPGIYINGGKKVIVK